MSWQHLRPAVVIICSLWALPTAAEERESLGFTLLDLNGDGEISQEEATGNKELVRRWLEIDADESGTVDAEEFAAFKIEQRAKSRPDEGLPPSRFNALDTDDNGVISPTEAASNRHLINNWSELDTDGSGSLDRSEFAVFEEVFLDTSNNFGASRDQPE